ncbi:MAG: 4Fe-4S binding protein [Peptococcaceae bacterium]|nr:4Fe-4S binding protein [Peptococcaceae bacterium]
MLIDATCIQCGICTDSCLLGAIVWQEKYLITEECTECRICITACPVGAIQAQTKLTP